MPGMPFRCAASLLALLVWLPAFKHVSTEASELAAAMRNHGAGRQVGLSPYADYRPLKEVPTELRVSTAEERRVMEYFDRRVSDVVPRLAPGVVWTTAGGPNLALGPDVTALSMLAFDACAADLVGTGVVGTRQPLVNDRVNALFTIHRIHIQRRMRPIPGSSEIRVATLSGSATTPQGTIQFGLDPLLRAGGTYAFILRRLEETDIYVPAPSSYRLVDLDSADGYPFETYQIVREFLADRSKYVAELARVAAGCPDR